MSGYTAECAAAFGVSEGGMNFLPKPFLEQELLAKLAEIMRGG